MNESNKDSRFLRVLAYFFTSTTSSMYLLCRLRTSDPESNSRSTPGTSKSSMRTGKRESVKNKLGNGINNVAFEGENEGRKETRKDNDAEESNNEFNRDSIYRFTVNPMFSSPEEENRSDIDDQYLPFRNTMYLPTDNCKYSNSKSEPIILLKLFLHDSHS